MCVCVCAGISDKYKWADRYKELGWYIGVGTERFCIGFRYVPTSTSFPTCRVPQ